MASQNAFPLMPPKSTELRLEHFDEQVYTADSTTTLYKLMDAMCGQSGSGTLKDEIFIQRLSGAISSIYGSDLDYIFGNMRFLSRSPDESYSYNTSIEMLTSDQWDEVAVKDAWYRARITEFFAASTAGGTADGVRLAVHAAVSVDCEVQEVWRYKDNYGLTTPLGRVPTAEMFVAVDMATGFRSYFSTYVNAQTFVASQPTPARWGIQREGPRTEAVVKPFKAALEPKERRLLRDMLDKITPQDTVITIDPQGLSVATPVTVRAVTADSTYYQVEKMVTGTPVLADLPAPEVLAIDLDPTEKWLFSRSPELAPYAQFNISQEYGYYYLTGGGPRSPIDAVTYGTLQADGSVVAEHPFQMFETTSQYTEWVEYEKADSPDNFPGGKFGITPETVPALNTDRSPYQFPYASQQEYVIEKKSAVLSIGGLADDVRYKLPIQRPSESKRTYTADLAIAYSAPARDSTVTSSYTCRRPRQNVHIGGVNPLTFVRS